MPEETLSVIILTLNEENNIKRCLQSLPKVTEVIVFDSGSSDKTTSIARKFGATVHEHPFVDYASQRNAALKKAKGEWIFFLDADEVVDEWFCKLLEKKSWMKASATAYRCKRQLVFMNRRMRFGKTIDFPVRLFRRLSGQYVGKVHEKLKFHEKTAIKNFPLGRICHYSYENLEDYFHRFNQYTTKIAIQHRDAGKNQTLILLCIRPWIEFLERYLVRLGFLDGYPGYAYALVSSLYAFIKYAKVKEMQG